MKSKFDDNWFKRSNITTSQCNAIQRPEKYDSILFKAFKVKLGSIIKNFSLAKVEMGNVIINEVESGRIKQFLQSNPTDIISESLKEKNNYIAVRTIIIPELILTLISNKNKVQAADVGEALACLKIDNAFFERDRSSNDTLELKFKNLNAITDFIRYEKRAINKKR